MTPERSPLLCGRVLNRYKGWWAASVSNDAGAEVLAPDEMFCRCSHDANLLTPDQISFLLAVPHVARQHDGTTSSPVAWDRVRATSVDVAMMAGTGSGGQARRRRFVVGVDVSGAPAVGF